MTALEQARALGMMAALGAALGGIYDLMGMMRRSRAGVGTSDLLFGMLCALGMTLTALYLLYIFSWTLTAIGQMIYFFRTYQKQTDGWEVPQTA